jgi:hypothetical protein
MLHKLGEVAERIGDGTEPRAIWAARFLTLRVSRGRQ